MGVASTYRDNDQRRHPRPWVVRVLLDETGVNHKDNTVDCNRGFRNIRGQHDLPGAFWRRFENFGLHIAGKVRVDRANNQLCDLVAQRAGCFLQVFMSGFNLFLALETAGKYGENGAVGTYLR